MAVHSDTLLRMSGGTACSWNDCRVAKTGPQWAILTTHMRKFGQWETFLNRLGFCVPYFPLHRADFFSSGMCHKRPT